MLHKWTHPRPLVDRVYHCDFDGPECGSSLEHDTTIVQPVDIYSTAIVVVVTMRTEHRRHSVSSWCCADVKTSLVGECIVISPEGQPERSSQAFLTSEDEIKQE